MKEKQKIKVVAYCDSPTSVTGFASVSRNILMGLYNTGNYDITVLGINYWGDPTTYPFDIYPIGINNDRDPYGRKRSFGMLKQLDFDILFILQDSFIVDFIPELKKYLASVGKKCKIICYYPIDAAPKQKWMGNVFAADYKVTYTEYAKRESLKAFGSTDVDLRVIPHGVNTVNFFPVADKARLDVFKKQYFGVNKDKFIITNINRNQRRKDIPRCIHAFKLFKEQVPDSLLYLHMASPDSQGWDLKEVCRAFELDTKTDVLLPENFSPNQGFPIEVVNYIYNVSDVVTSTALGEGWGMEWIEAMATKVPVLMPDNTAITENITEDCGYLIKSGSNNNLFTVLTSDNEVIRPLVDVDDMVKKLLRIYNNRDEAKAKAEVAYKWVLNNLTWNHSVVPMWIDLFDLAYSELATTEVVTGPMTVSAEVI